MITLDREEEELFNNYLICRMLLEESNLSKFGLMTAIIRNCKYSTVQEAREDLVELQLAIEKSPRIQQLLAEREWFIEFKNGRHFRTYKRTITEKITESIVGLLESVIGSICYVLNLIVSVAAIKGVQLFTAGFVSGMTVVLMVYKPLFIYKIFVFVFTTGFFGAVVLFVSISLFERYVISLNSPEPWSSGQKIGFTCVILTCLLIAISVGIMMTGDVRQSSNPYDDDREQIYW